MNNYREGFPYKFLLHLNFNQVILNFGDPFARILLTVSIDSQTKTITRYPIAKKETLINEIISFELVLHQFSIHKFHDSSAHIEVLLIKKDNQKRFVGDYNVNLAEIAHKVNKSTSFEELRIVDLNNSSHYNGKLQFWINLIHQTKKQTRSLSQTHFELRQVSPIKEMKEKVEKLKKAGIKNNENDFQLNITSKEHEKIDIKERANSFAGNDQNNEEFEFTNEKPEKEIQTLFEFEKYILEKEEQMKKMKEIEEIKEREINIIKEELSKSQENQKLMLENIKNLEDSLQEVIGKNRKDSCLNEENEILITKLQEDNNALKIKNESLSNELEKSIKIEENDEKTIETLKNSIEQYKEKTKELIEKLDDALREKANGGIEIETMKNEHKNLQLFNENLKKQITNKEKKLSELEEINVKLQEDFLRNKQKLADVLNLIFDKGAIDLMEDIEKLMGLEG